MIVMEYGHACFYKNICVFLINTLPETNSSHLKMDGWIVSFWDGLFLGAMLVSGSVYISYIYIYT